MIFSEYADSILFFIAGTLSFIWGEGHWLPTCLGVVLLSLAVGCAWSEKHYGLKGRKKR